MQLRGEVILDGVGPHLVSEEQRSIKTGHETQQGGEVFAAEVTELNITKERDIIRDESISYVSASYRTNCSFS